ncbi:uncharacterized protein LOC111074498 [Drosophila obscura]|uniref:uncharacterized protein LOC111074498 n=1 Tax=Drosophila obscura TaxID=7282 RepID=UPI001BB25165|nr:uncharacterized protein LOC111074498 [Drosophila obscura]
MSTKDVYAVGVTCNYGMTIAMIKNDYTLYHLGDHIYCCARILARNIIGGIKDQLADQYLNQNQNIPVKKAQQLLWQKYPDIATDPFLLAAQEDNRQYLYAPQLDGSASNNNHIAVCGRGTAIAKTMNWLVDNWDKDQNLKKSEQMARVALKNWDTFHNRTMDVIVLYKRKEDAPMDIDDPNE